MVIIQVLGYTISGPNYTVQASLIFILLVLTLGKAKGDWCCLGRNNERSSRNRSYSIPSGHGIIFESCVARSATSRRGHDVQILRLCCPDSHFFGLFYLCSGPKVFGAAKGDLVRMNFLVFYYTCRQFRFDILLSAIACFNSYNNLIKQNWNLQGL